MSTLYVSDLDGTLLRSDERLSGFTAQTINELVSRGLLFSYATARSLVTARKVTAGLDARIPLIVYNGAFIKDSTSGSVMASNFFGDEAADMLQTLMDGGVYPIVYAEVDGVERFSFWPEKCSAPMNDFLRTRQNDPRTRIVHSAEALGAGHCFYFTCIDAEEKLAPLHAHFRDQCRCVYQRDIYSGEMWLELMPPKANKAHAALQLKQLLGCDRLVVFGDGVNDLPMFEIADECYAMQNAHPDLKAKATSVIGTNDEDSVAKWLLKHAEWRGT